MKTAIPVLFLLLCPFWLQAADVPDTDGHTRLLGDEGQTVTADALSQVDLTTGQTSTSLQMTGQSEATAPVGQEPLRVTRHTGQIGQSTRDLLRLQASGEAAGPMLPMLGQASSAAYKRYLDSFRHSIPEFFDTTVESSGGGK